MKLPIGFHTEIQEEKESVAANSGKRKTIVPRKSVVQVYFPLRGMTLSYYNDKFDLHCGDVVFVEGKLEGARGRVVDVTYQFKIKLSDYKRVIAVADTEVQGEFFLAGSQLVSFDEESIPFEKVITWFRAPLKPEDEYVSGYDEKAFALDRLKDMGASSSVAERGVNYYHDDRVVYLSVKSNGLGHAIVQGSEPYVVEFRYEDGMVSNLTCTCFCAYPCKHQFAAMLQLKKMLELIMKHYAKHYEASDYFAAVAKSVFLSYVMERKETGSFKL